MCKSTKQIDEYYNALQKHYNLRNLGKLQWCLGLRFKQNIRNGTISIDQQTYTETILKRFNMQECKGALTPSMQIPLTKAMSPTNEEKVKDMINVPYRQAVGALNYLAVCTRPDIANAVSSVSRYLNNPGPQHWTAVKHILRYLKKTSTHGLIFKAKGSDLNNIGPNYSDADWAGCLDTRRSTTGYIFFLSGSPITWRSRRQTTPALSSTEAEYMALTEAAQEIHWLRSLIQDIGFKQHNPTKLYGDNRGSIKLSNNPIFHKRTKHIDIKHHFIREAVENKIVALEWIPTEDMVADIFTKSLKPVKFNRLLPRFMSPIESETQPETPSPTS